MRINLGSIDKRKLARIVAVVAVALAAGHLVQTLAARKTAAPQSVSAVVPDSPKPIAVVQLAGSNDPVVEPAPKQAPLPPVALAVTPVAPKPVPTPEPVRAPDPVAKMDPCAVSLDLLGQPGAMLGLTLLAPCHPGERVVVHHAGLAVTYMTMATGSLFVSMPALDVSGAVEVKFADGTKADATLPVPDLAGLRRFGVQWQGADAFQVFGYQDDDAISAANPGLAPVGSDIATTGFLTLLGDTRAASPLLAEIYTFPAAGPSEVVIEAAVTPTTCGREILGETLASVAGAVTVVDLSLSMPECDAVGDFLVLKNLGQDLTLAAAN